MSTQSSTQRLKVDTLELQQQQLNAAEDPENSEIKQTTGNFDEDYEFPAHEQHLMHVRLTKKVNDPALKKYRTEETIWKGSPAQYKRMSETPENGGNDSFGEYDGVEILHDVRPAALSAARTPRASAEPTGEGKKPQLRSLKDAQARFKELLGVDSPAHRTFTEVKEVIAHLEEAEKLGKLEEVKAEVLAGLSEE